MLNKRRKNNNSSWIGKYSIQIHGSIAIWKAIKDNGKNMQYKHQAMQYEFE